PQDRSQVRDELQDGSQHCPEECPGNADDQQADGPENHHSEGVQELSQKPVLDGAPAQPQVVAEIHLFSDAGIRGGDSARPHVNPERANSSLERLEEMGAQWLAQHCELWWTASRGRSQMRNSIRSD